MTPLRRCAILMLAAGAVASAQDKPSPPPRTPQPETAVPGRPLPALSFPEYVITGEDVIRMEERTKEPPQVPRTDPTTSRAGLGEREMYRPIERLHDPLAFSPIVGPASKARAEASFGRFRTGRAEAWYADRFPRADVAAHAVWEGSDGFVPRSSYTTWGFDLSGGSWFPPDASPLLARSRIAGDAAVSRMAYGLYANRLAALPAAPAFRRSDTRLTGGATLVARDNAILDYTVRVFAAQTALREHVSADDSLEISSYSEIENRFGVDGAVRFPAAGHTVDADLRAALSSDTRTVGSSTQPLFVRVGARTRHAFDPSWSLAGGLRWTFTRGNTGATVGRLFPSATLTYDWRDGMSAYLQAEGLVEENTFRDLLDRNPYLALGSLLDADVTPLRVSIGTRYDDRIRARAAVALEYRYATRYTRFVRLPEPLRAQWATRTSGVVDITALRADGALRFDGSGELRGHALIRSSEDRNAGTGVLYLPRFELSASYVLRFAVPLEATVTVEALGARDTETGTLPATFLLGARAEYRPASFAGVFLAVDNLFDRSYEIWPGYDGRPFFASGGIVIRI